MNELELSNEILNLIKNNILLKTRFLEIMIYRLNAICFPLITFGTNGVDIFYNPYYLIEYFKQNKVNASRLYLHSCFHALLRNTFESKHKDELFWDVACDICVENIIDEFNVETYNRPGIEERSAIVNEIRKNITSLQPNFVYSYLKSNPDKVELYKKLFELDNHTIWSGRGNCDKCDESNDGSSENSSNKDKNSESDSKYDDTYLNGSSGSDASNDNSSNDSDSFDEHEKMWSEISNKLMIEIQCFSKEIGVEAGSLFTQLGAVKKEKYDYESFLRKFSILRETPKINMDEFDMIFYTYGLDTYGNMPLIEPLEYKEDYMIRDFVIAIDTSCSVQGETVKNFLNKTYNILETTNSFGKKFNLHIIQCDTKIQHAVKITSKVEFDNYIKNCEIYGFGGTDFTPVFIYVDQLIKNKEFTKLKGLIYFTDGYGTFPVKKTPYETCFAFVDKIDYDSVVVPVWAKKIFLDSEDL